MRSPAGSRRRLTLYDANNREVAYADDNQFRPDPVLYYRVPQDGSYELEIRDSIYRGREDFVYRITVGEIPFLTHVFPLGMQAGQSGTVELYGWNLPVRDRCRSMPRRKNRAAIRSRSRTASSSRTR